MRSCGGVGLLGGGNRVMNRYVEITFDCLPLRSLSRMDVPMDASPKYRARCERLLQLVERHGSHNVYYLYNARCVFHLTNKPDLGSLEYKFDGVVMTDEADETTTSADLAIQLEQETCDWLTAPVVAWFNECVTHAVKAEFDRYIVAGDLAQTIERVKRLQAQADQQGGYVGMYL
jgi:hypothetical protein